MPLDVEATKATLRELCQITVPVTDDDAGRIGLFLIVAVQDLLDELTAARAILVDALAEVRRLREAAAPALLQLDLILQGDFGPDTNDDDAVDAANALRAALEGKA